MLPLLCLLCLPLANKGSLGWVLLVEATVRRVTLCRSTPGTALCSRAPPWAPGIAKEYKHHQSRHQAIQRQHLRSVIHPAAGKPSMSIPADSPAINCALWQVRRLPDWLWVGETDTVYSFRPEKGNSDSLADRLWKERTSCGGWYFLVGSVVANCSIPRIRNLFKHNIQPSHVDFHWLQVRNPGRIICFRWALSIEPVQKKKKSFRAACCNFFNIIASLACGSFHSLRF